ncbi:MAG TPA: aldo/keto reductase [Ilumatobacteraceae bacterium]|jgi:aryl-alcohol dehydrogenase-like predicted oxidoreductase
MTANPDESSIDVGRIGFGAMHLSERGRPSRPIAIETVHAALDAGARLIDTADAYCQHSGETGHNEVLVTEALEKWTGDRSSITVATKGGHVRDRYGGWSVDGRPEHLEAAAHASRARLHTDMIDLYQFHRPDPNVEFGRSVGALAHLQREGVVRHVGLSNVDVAQIELAGAIVHVSSVQNELSPMELDSLPVVAWCHHAGVPFIVWAPFGGRERGRTLADDPMLNPFMSTAVDMGTTVYQVVLAWLMSLSPMVVPIPGASRPSTITDSIAAQMVLLDDAALTTLDRAVAQRAGTGNVDRDLEALRALAVAKSEELA